MKVLLSAQDAINQNFIQVAEAGHQRADILSFLFIIVHIPLALLIHKNADIATVHAYSVLAVGVISCIVGRLDIAAAAAAYITGAEVLWRMSDASVFWEFGKYASILIFTLGIVRSGIRNAGLPFLYFGLLVPSAILTVETSTAFDAQNQLSFNLSGPLALLAGAWFFSRLAFNKQQIRRIFVALLAPICGIAAVAIFSTFTATSIHFSDDSNPMTSGGYGPNQVSSMLGLGALTSVLFLITAKSKFLKFILIVFATVLLSQCLLTFSRGGAYMAVSSIFVAALLLVRQPKKLFTFVSGLVVITVVFSLWIFPWLNSFTGGVLVERYSDRGTTGRSEIIEDDLRIFAEHPILGVGPGKADSLRYLYKSGIAAHTEYTRMLSEHGMLGLLAILVLILIAVRNFRNASGEWKAIAASFVFWAMTYMVINAMRLVAPSFLIGLTSAEVVEDDEYILVEEVPDEVDT